MSSKSTQLVHIRLPIPVVQAVDSACAEFNRQHHSALNRSDMIRLLLAVAIERGEEPNKPNA